jgi:hypothetical protein
VDVMANLEPRRGGRRGAVLGDIAREPVLGRLDQRRAVVFVIVRINVKIGHVVASYN